MEAKNLPLRHITIRVPWHDTGWAGNICNKPEDNIACLILDRIRETRDDAAEEAIAGQSWEDLPEEDLPPCVAERGNFMSPYAITRKLSHPYAKISKSHQHLLPTTYRYPPYSASSVPFSWMLSEEAHQKASMLDLDFREELEEKAHEIMRFKTTWLQTKHNQLTMLDTFFGALQPNKSLCFFYAKRTPLTEDSRRVIIGVGWVTDVGQSKEYEYSESGHFIGSVLWERPVYHSIRDNFNEGFLFPYHQVLEYLDEHPEETPEDFIAFAPDEHFWSFSFAAEHLTHDGAIASILACLRAMANIKRVVPGEWGKVEVWLNARLNELWGMRGPCPGLGSALSAFGVQHGTLLAYEIESILVDSENLDPWPFVDQLFRDPLTQVEHLQKYVTPTLSKKWQALPDERRELVMLLSRFELSIEQATCWYVKEDSRRQNLDVDITDAELLTNPYLLYELDRGAADPVFLSTIDRGLFPDDSGREEYPIPTPSGLEDSTDPRRVRAFVVAQLEKAAVNGHTLYLRDDIIRAIRDLEVQPPCLVDGDLMRVVEDTFPPVVNVIDISDRRAAYQLDRLEETGKVIRAAVNRRLRGQRHQVEIDWRERLDASFGGKAPEDDQEEQDARQEKGEALQELFASRISVLIGPAGTGKTTLLKVLCNAPEVKNEGVLLLAPTGKARVRMETQTETKGAQTIAQFLLAHERYDTSTRCYIVSKTARMYQGSSTVIIDESSMLTEEQLGALISSLSGVKRLVLVGDHRQLPPIGAGRPFLDIVQHLAPENVETLFPRVAPGFAELTIRRRQTGSDDRDDLLLADWFSGRSLDPGADEIWSRISEDATSNEVRFIRWDHHDELREKLLAAIVEELELDGIEDTDGFEISLGGSKFKERGVFFWAGRDGKPGACGKVENWQILSPVRNQPQGVEAINRSIQSTFRAKTKEFATARRRRIPKPMGREEIIYGDKVIQNQNERRYKVWPKDGALQYVANGEIGIVVGQFKGKNAKYSGLPWKMEVEFSSQPGYKYDYSNWDFGEDTDPKIELAYALTIHKVQGSEFGIGFLVLPNPCRLLSRELLYTALTRQIEKVVILHQGERNELKTYSSDSYSEAARRLTNLFVSPDPVEIRDRFLEDRLIHRTRRSDMVRSKSEVIIADLLYSKGIDYQYELALPDHDGGKPRYPDFTFEDDEMGVTYYWEHLGMLRQPKYRRRWERKLAWYRDQGILPNDESGGPNGTLIITKDDIHGGIQSNEIEQMLNEILGL